MKTTNKSAQNSRKRLSRRQLLNRVKWMITEEPKRISMPMILKTDVTGRNAPSCGTVGCIAGWTCVVAEMSERKQKVRDAGYYVLRGYDIIGRAARLLGLSGEQAYRLFYLCHWPSELSREYDRARTKNKESKITCRRIDLFLRTNGEQ